MKRPLILAVPLALALAVTLGACGDDDDDDAPATVVTAATDTSPEVSNTAESPEESPEVSTPDPGTRMTIPASLPADAEDFVARLFPSLDEDQVQCLAENLGSSFDPNEAMTLLSECNIELTDLTPAG